MAAPSFGDFDPNFDFDAGGSPFDEEPGQESRRPAFANRSWGGPLQDPPSWQDLSGPGKGMKGGPHAMPPDGAPQFGMLGPQGPPTPFNPPQGTAPGWSGPTQLPKFAEQPPFGHPSRPPPQQPGQGGGFFQQPDVPPGPGGDFLQQPQHKSELPPPPSQPPRGYTQPQQQSEVPSSAFFHDMSGGPMPSFAGPPMPPFSGGPQQSYDMPPEMSPFGPGQKGQKGQGPQQQPFSGRPDSPFDMPPEMSPFGAGQKGQKGQGSRPGPQGHDQPQGPEDGGMDPGSWPGAWPPGGPSPPNGGFHNDPQSRSRGPDYPDHPGFQPEGPQGPGQGQQQQQQQQMPFQQQPQMMQQGPGQPQMQMQQGGPGMPPQMAFVFFGNMPGNMPMPGSPTNMPMPGGMPMAMGPDMGPSDFQMRQGEGGQRQGQAQAPPPQQRQGQNQNANRRRGQGQQGDEEARQPQQEYNDMPPDMSPQQMHYQQQMLFQQQQLMQAWWQEQQQQQAVFGDGFKGKGGPFNDGGKAGPFGDGGKGMGTPFGDGDMGGPFGDGGKGSPFGGGKPNMYGKGVDAYGKSGDDFNKGGDGYAGDGYGKGDQRRRRDNIQRLQSGDWQEGAAWGGDWQQAAAQQAGQQKGGPFDKFGSIGDGSGAYIPPHRRGKKGGKGPDPDDVQALGRAGERPLGWAPGKGGPSGQQARSDQSGHMQHGDQSGNMRGGVPPQPAQSRGKGRDNVKGGKGDQDQRRKGGGLASTLRDIGKPSAPSKAQEARAAKAASRGHGHAEPERSPEGASGGVPGGPAGSSGAPAGAGPGGKGKGKGKLRGAPLPGRSLKVSWVLPGDGPSPEGGDGVGDAAALAAAFGVEESDLMDMRDVCVRLENAVTGCQVTVSLNGEKNILNSTGFGRKRGGVASQERRYKICPLGGVPQETPEGPAEAVPEASAAAVPEVPPEVTGSEETVPNELVQEDGGTAAASSMSVEPCSIGVPVSGSEVLDESSVAEAADPVSFTAMVTLDTNELQAKTTQELVDPDVEVVDVFDTAVVLRMTELTGDRFELTVYASGSSDLAGNAATLVHRGPIRLSESVHRIGQLEPSQVYVAWVKVFCEEQVRESKQKGFKTPQARVKTIWDEADHVILGVEKTATFKEITKAFRQKSLQCHPDKETDPEKKDMAEETMKRLNLAKSNMLRSAPREPCDPDPGCEPPSPEANPFGDMATQPMPPQRRRKHHDHGGFGDSGDEFSSGSGSDFDPFKGHGKGKGKNAEAPPAASPFVLPKGSLGVSLRIEAAKPPKLQVIERHLTSLVIEAFALPLGGRVEVQKFADDMWQSALPAVQVTAESMRFTLPDLEENSCHRLRLRTTIEMEPLRLGFAKFSGGNQALSSFAPPAFSRSTNLFGEGLLGGEAAAQEGETEEPERGDPEEPAEQDVQESDGELQGEQEQEEERGAEATQEREEQGEDGQEREQASREGESELITEGL